MAGGDRASGGFFVSVDGDLPIYRRAGFESSLVSLPANGARTLHESLELAAAAFGTRPCLGFRRTLRSTPPPACVPTLGPYEWLSYAEVQGRVSALASGLRTLGLGPGSRLAFFCRTCLEWVLMSYACYAQSVTVLTVYPNLGEEGLRQALEDAAVSTVFIHNSLAATLAAVLPAMPAIKTVVVHVTSAEAASLAPLRAIAGLHLHLLEDVERAGVAHSVEAVPPAPTDVACIMYTSGTAGRPKGVVISHANVVASFSGMLQCMAIHSSDVYLSYLPLAHIFAFVVQACLLNQGAMIGMGTPKTLLASQCEHCEGDIASLSPSIFVGVPYLFERVMSGVFRAVANSSFFTRTLFNWAYAYRAKHVGRGRSTPLVSHVFAGPARRIFGSRLRLVITGSAPTSPALHTFLRVILGAAIVLQGYGLTEAACAGFVQLCGDPAVGTIGAPFPSIEAKLVPVRDFGHDAVGRRRGEIYLRGPTIAAGGYHNMPELSAETFRADGWLATGDVGEIDDRGSFVILDRLKNYVKCSHGDYVALDHLEQVYHDSNLFEHLLLHAVATKYHVVAIGVPNREKLLAWAAAQADDDPDIAHATFEQLCATDRARKHVLAIMAEVAAAAKLRNIEVVGDVLLLAEPWTVENQRLTPALKINRSIIIKAHADDIQMMYQRIAEQGAPKIQETFSTRELHVAAHRMHEGTSHQARQEEVAGVAEAN